jgi:hypothetical protein
VVAYVKAQQFPENESVVVLDPLVKECLFTHSSHYHHHHLHCLILYKQAPKNLLVQHHCQILCHAIILLPEVEELLSPLPSTINTIT